MRDDTLRNPGMVDMIINGNYLVDPLGPKRNVWVQNDSKIQQDLPTEN